MNKYKELSIEDKCLVQRYRYYVLNNPTITDLEYDLIDKIAKKVANLDHQILKPGSSLKESYPEYIREIAENEVDR